MSALNTYFYFVYELEDPAETTEARRFETRWDNEFPTRLAEDAANHYFYKHDGYEESWPLTFIIMDEKGNRQGEFSVELETTPLFTARLVK